MPVRHAVFVGLVGSCDEDDGVVEVEGFFSLRSSSSFFAVMRMSVSWMVQLPLRYSLVEEGGGGGGGCCCVAVVVMLWMRCRLCCWSGWIDGCCNGVVEVEGSDMVMIWHEIILRLFFFVIVEDVMRGENE